MGGNLTATTLPARAGARSTRHRHARVVLLLVVLAIAVAGAGALWPSPAAAGVDDSIAAALSSAGLAGSGTGVYVWDLDAARPIYEHNSSTGFAPASNMKLVTSAAALRYWGTGHRFSTELYAPDLAGRRPASSTATSTCAASATPASPRARTSSDVFDLTTASFETFAKAVKREGIKKVTGRVLGDASWFDKLRTVPYWKSGLQLECGPLSALSGDQGLDNGNRVAAPATWAAKLMTKALRNAGVKVKGKPGTGNVPEHGPAGQAAVLRRAPRDPQAHEQGERQLLRRDAPQGARQGLLRRRQHRGRHQGEQGHPARDGRPGPAPTSSRTAPA